MKSSYEKIKVYDYKEIEIDDADIPYLTNKQTLYVSLDGKLNDNMGQNPFAIK